MNSPSLYFATGIMVVTLAVPSAANASLIAYEGFDYPAGSMVDSQNGGFGFTSPWNGSNAHTIGPAGLSFANLTTSGSTSSLPTPTTTGTSVVSRSFAAAAPTVYFSFLARPTGTLGVGSFNGYFGLNINSSGNDVFVGKPGGGALNEWVMEQPGGATQVASGEAVVVDQTTLIVLRMDLVAGPDTLTMYVDPTPGGPEPAAGTVQTGIDLGFLQSISLNSTGMHSLDEIRIGTTFAAVSVPEPSSFLALLTVFGIGLLGKKAFATSDEELATAAESGNGLSL